VTDSLLVEARGLTKIYPARGSSSEFRAVDGIDFELRRGEAFGFLGPNGAGKSSTMRMVSAISPITGGTLRVLGMDPVRQGPQIRARIGVVPQDDCLDRELTVRENLFIYGRYFGLKRPVIRERLAGLLEFAQLQDKAEDQVETLSGGMRRRLTIARALINEPEILLLDEPTTGLDPQARHVLWDRLFRLKQNGVTLILTTHYMDEAEQLCDRLVVLDRGKIVAHGSPRELIDAHVTREVLELRFPVGEQESSARTIRNGTFRSGASIGARVEALPDRVVVYADDGEAALAAIHAASLSPLTALVRRASLEDVFLELTGRSLIE
jgi:lipooligosaccharide transport system ATP-binding protein